MSEEHANPETTDAVEELSDGPIRTGVERVDAVVDAVAHLEGRPVDEHVAVFESAHDELRRTLDSHSDDTE